MVEARNDVVSLMEAWSRYRQARIELLKTLDLSTSNRDPLAEFSERLVAGILGGTLASNRVQKGWDVEAPGIGRVQVRYLANPAATWVNGHVISHTQEMDEYALVIFEDFKATAILTFRNGCREAVCSHLKTRRNGHPVHKVCLELGKEDVRRLIRERSEFSRMGVTVYLPDDGGDWANLS